MYFMPKYRYNPESGREEDYLTLKESFRDKAGRVRTRTLLTVGFVQTRASSRRRTYSCSKRKASATFAGAGAGGQITSFPPTTGR